jgi:hypothetical protein
MTNEERTALCRRAVALLGYKLTLKGNHFEKDGRRFPVGVIDAFEYASRLEQAIAIMEAKLAAAEREQSDRYEEGYRDGQQQVWDDEAGK